MKKIISVIAIAAFSTPVMADNNVGGFYGSTGGGVYRFKADGFRDTAPTMKVLGGYSFNDYVALEGAYTRLFEASDRIDETNVDLDGNVWDVSAKLSWPLGTRFAPYGRLGWSYVDLSATATEDGMRVRVNEYDNAFAWAAGTNVNLTRRLGLTGEYARTMIDNGDLDLLSVNLKYRFGGF